MQQNVTVLEQGTRAAAPWRRAGPRTARARRSRAFTVMEVLTIVALLGVLAVLSVNAVGPLRDRMRRYESFSQLASALVRARMAAQETGDCYFVELANDFNYDTKEYSGFTTGTNASARYVVIRRMRYADCALSPPQDVLGSYPVAPGPSSPLSLVEAVAAPFSSPQGRPQVRVFQGQIMVTPVESGQTLGIPLIFRPNGRVRNGGVTSALRFYITSPDIANPLGDRRIIVHANGRVCMEDDLLGGGTRCY